MENMMWFLGCRLSCDCIFSGLARVFGILDWINRMSLFNRIWCLILVDFVLFVWIIYCRDSGCLHCCVTMFIWNCVVIYKYLLSSRTLFFQNEMISTKVREILTTNIILSIRRHSPEIFESPIILIKVP